MADAKITGLTEDTAVNFRVVDKIEGWDKLPL